MRQIKGMTREFYIPKDSTLIGNKTDSAVCYISQGSRFNGTGYFCAIGFHGKANHPDFNFSYSKQEARDLKVREYLNNWDDWTKRKAEEERKPSATANRNKIIKDRLSRVFGREYVQVKGNRGTAYGWLDIHVQLPKPADCIGNSEDGMPYRHSHQCGACKQTEISAERVIEMLIEDQEFGSYCADDGYNTMHRELNIDVNCER